MTFPAPPGFVDQLLGLGESWEDRVKEAAYTSPSGTRIKFLYEDVARVTPLRTQEYNFPLVNGGYVQQNGYGSRQYALTCYFTGASHDLEAGAFEAACLEHGIGKLEHPFYGTFNVVPFGSIERRDDLKTAANQTVITVTFWTTVGILYPASQTSPKNEILAAIDTFDVAAAQQFSDLTTLASTAQQVSAKATIRKFLGDIEASLASVSKSVSSVRKDFQDVQDIINTSLDVLVGQPIALAQQTLNLVRAPAVAVDGLVSRLDAYRSLLERMLDGKEGNPSNSIGADSAVTFIRRKTRNDFHLSDLIASGAVASSTVAAIETDYTTKPEAIAAAEKVLEQFDDLVAWKEEQFAAVGQLDPGGAVQALRQAAMLTAGFLVETSFSLIPERAIVLDRPRTIINVAAELYGEVTNERLDFLLNSNDLNGSEILQLPRGKRIVYYT